MRKSVTRLAAIGLLAGVVSASAAIQPGPWTTFYTGLNGGYGWGEPSGSGVGLIAGVPSSLFATTPGTLYPPFGGGTFGGQLGFDLQLDQWMVVGLKYDMDWSNMMGSTIVSPFSTQGTTYTGYLYASEKLTWFGDLLPRLGFLPIQNLLIYATGGLAFGHLEGSSNENFGTTPNSQYPGSFSNVVPGWAVGAGAEWLITPHWSLSGEYLYNELDNVTFIANPVPAYPPNAAQVTAVTNYQTTELAINYRF